MTVHIKRGLPLAPVREREVLRYAGNSRDKEAMRLLESVNIPEISDVCYAVFDLTLDGDVCDFGFFTVRSASLSKSLAGCRSALIFCATVGIGYDRAIVANTRLSPAKALMISALGSERAEALCDSFCEAISKELGVALKPRFSPGYGDLSLDVQKSIFALLEPSKRIGVSLSEQLIMTPTKSVTAIVGICEKRYEF